MSNFKKLLVPKNAKCQKLPTPIAKCKMPKSVKKMPKFDKIFKNSKKSKLHKKFTIYSQQLTFYTTKTYIGCFMYAGFIGGGGGGAEGIVWLTGANCG